MAIMYKTDYKRFTFLAQIAAEVLVYSRAVNPDFKNQ